MGFSTPRSDQLIDPLNPSCRPPQLHTHIIQSSHLTASPLQSIWTRSRPLQRGLEAVCESALQVQALDVSTHCLVMVVALENPGTHHLDLHHTS